MPPDLLLSLAGIAVGALILLYLGQQLARRRRRARLRRTSFPAAWQEVLEKDFPLYRRLPADLREQLHFRIQVIVAEKRFIGCQGLLVTDEMRVLIAAQAAVLILNRDTEIYPGLHTIFLYPSAYIANESRTDATGVQHHEASVRLGESWHAGPLVLSWNDVNRGAYNLHDGHNVTMHEFAHQLDQEDDAPDGTPLLADRSRYASWAKTFRHDFVALRRTLERGGHDLLDAYAATDPAEFFAVATEVFFEKPTRLRERHPELYAELQAYYRLDPSAWPA